jgi:acyl-CoA synthetase (AMP-forming)/AMP-acid ligase II
VALSPKIDRIFTSFSIFSITCCGPTPGQTAIIRPVAGATLTEDEIKEFCKQRMAKFKVPQYCVFQHEDFPKTSIGKIRKNIIRDDVLKNCDKS